MPFLVNFQISLVQPQVILLKQHPQEFFNEVWVTARLLDDQSTQGLIQSIACQVMVQQRLAFGIVQRFQVQLEQPLGS